MNKTKQAGMSGKGFYAALSLSVAMVGAACWYAYSAAGKPQQPQIAESSVTADQTAPAVTSVTAQAGLTERPQSSARTVTVTTVTVTAPDAEEAAALVHKTASETDASVTVTAETTALAVLPMMPVNGAVVQPFSNGELVKSQTTGIWQTHNGADFAASPGTEVYAVLDGTVTSVERDALWGICVTMLHDDGTVTRFCGLNEGLNAEAGQVLPRGTVLGAVGDTNEAESAQMSHLHFEVLKNVKFIDPELFLSGASAEAQNAQ